MKGLCICIHVASSEYCLFGPLVPIPLQDGRHSAEDNVERLSTAAESDSSVSAKAMGVQRGGYRSSQGADHGWTGPTGERAC